MIDAAVQSVAARPIFSAGIAGPTLAYWLKRAADAGRARARASSRRLRHRLLGTGLRTRWRQLLEAFSAYETRLRSYIARKQRGAKRFAAAFAPRTSRGLWFRNQVVRAFSLPGAARLVVGRDIADRLDLPDYRWEERDEGATELRGGRGSCDDAIVPLFCPTRQNPRLASQNTGLVSP